MPNQIREASVADVEIIVSLSEQRRIQYQAYQPLFWRKAADSAAKQKPFLENQITQDHIIALVYIEDEAISGFVIGNIGRGNQCNIDDFVIANQAQWESVGKSLLDEIMRLAKESGITKAEVVCGHLDQPKQSMLQSAGLKVERYWFTRAIERFGHMDAEISVRPALPDDAAPLAQLLGCPDAQVPEMGNERMTVLVSSIDGTIRGCLVALIVPTPPVYDPEGDTCLVTEFAVEASAQQEEVCQALLNTMGGKASAEGAVQYVVMCGSVDHHAQSLLTKFGMTIASEWCQGSIK